MSNKYCYCDDYVKVYLDDCFTKLKELAEESVDMIFADPPYFLSNGGISNSGGKVVCVDKGNWDKIGSLEEKHLFNRTWIKLAKKVLKQNGTIWITGTFHNIYSIGMALEQEGFKILNNITWQKTNPAPNISCRYFTHSTETIIWARKNNKNAKHYYNYDLMKKLNNNKQMKDVWTGSLTNKNEKKYGKHPTQKPEYILEKIILASTKENDVILDPFLGSGTTAVVAKRLKRKCIGIENKQEYIEIVKKRLKDV
ncbi:MAG: site-specific DNA-methyltransferase [Bacilli bacterium]|nr:site-specific DNA-methyltransferase [Bacilli bacterium]